MSDIKIYRALTDYWNQILEYLQKAQERLEASFEDVKNTSLIFSFLDKIKADIQRIKDTYVDLDTKINKKIDELKG